MASIFLRMGLAFVFIYAAFASFLFPSEWIGYFPEILDFLPDRLVIGAFSVFQIILGVTILFKHHVTWPALVAAITLIGVIVANIGDTNIAFLNVGLALSALSLMFIGKIRA